MAPDPDTPAPSKHVLDDAKAMRLGGRTMLIPSPRQLLEAMQKIPTGSTKTLKQVRQELAAQEEVDVTCPFMARKCWEMVASMGLADAPWWRITLEGKANAKVPGGVLRHRELALAEGSRIS